MHHCHLHPNTMQYFMHAVVLVTGLVVASLCSTSALSGSFSSRRLQAPATCVLTPSDVEGPYYLPGVPLRSAQAHYCPPVTTKPFTNLSIVGTVSSALNKCKKLANATIEVRTQETCTCVLLPGPWHSAFLSRNRLQSSLSYHHMEAVLRTVALFHWSERSGRPTMLAHMM